MVAVVASACGLSDTDLSDRSRRRPRFPSAAGSSGTAGGSPAGSSDPGGRGGNAGQNEAGGGGVAAIGVGGGGGPNPMPPAFDAGTDPDRNAVVAGELCERFATIQCAGEATCCPSAGRDFDTCKSALMGGCSADLLFDQIAMQPAAGFDPAGTRTMMDEFERLTSICDPGIVAFGESQQGLRRMFAGTVAPNQSCRPSNPLSKAQAGAALAACTMSETTACLPTALTWNCAARAGAGGACFTDINCVPGFFCDNPNLDITGSFCMARKADGAACKTGNECSSLFCSAGKCVPPNVAGAYCPQ